MDETNEKATTNQRPEPEVRIPERPLLSGLYHVIKLSPERVEVANAGRSIALNGKGFADKVMPLLDALDGATTMDEVTSRFPDLAVPVVKALVQRGMVTDAAPQPDTAQAAPQLASMAFPGLATAAEAAERLLAARVAICGCGPVGAHVAVALAKAGVGSIILADSQAVSAGDVATAVVYGPEAEGLPRAKAALALVEAVSTPKAEIVDLPLNDKQLAGLGLGIIEIGYDDESQGPADAFLQAAVPYLPFSQDALEAVAGPLVGPGGEPCHRCLEYRRQSHLAHLGEYLAYRRHRAEDAPGADAFLAARSAMVAGAVATEALRALLDASPQERHIATILDLARTSIEKEEVFLIPTCEACDKAKAWAPGREVNLMGNGND